MYAGAVAEVLGLWIAPAVGLCRGDAECARRGVLQDTVRGRGLQEVDLVAQRLEARVGRLGGPLHLQVTLGLVVRDDRCPRRHRGEPADHHDHRERHRQRHAGLVEAEATQTSAPGAGTLAWLRRHVLVRPYRARSNDSHCLTFPGPAASTCCQTVPRPPSRLDRCSVGVHCCQQPESGCVPVGTRCAFEVLLGPVQTQGAAGGDVFDALVVGDPGAVLQVDRLRRDRAGQVRVALDPDRRERRVHGHHEVAGELDAVEGDIGRRWLGLPRRYS